MVEEYKFYVWSSQIRNGLVSFQNLFSKLINHFTQMDERKDPTLTETLKSAWSTIRAKFDYNFNPETFKPEYLESDMYMSQNYNNEDFFKFCESLAEVCWMEENSPEDSMELDLEAAESLKKEVVVERKGEDFKLRGLQEPQEVKAKPKLSAEDMKKFTQLVMKPKESMASNQVGILFRSGDAFFCYLRGVLLESIIKDWSHEENDVVTAWDCYKTALNFCNANPGNKVFVSRILSHRKSLDELRSVHDDLEDLKEQLYEIKDFQEIERRIKLGDITGKDRETLTTDLLQLIKEGQTPFAQALYIVLTFSPSR